MAVVGHWSQGCSEAGVDLQNDHDCSAPLPMKYVDAVAGRRPHSMGQSTPTTYSAS